MFLPFNMIFSLKDQNKSVCVQEKKQEWDWLISIIMSPIHRERGRYKSDSKNSEENKQEVW